MSFRNYYDTSSYGRRDTSKSGSGSASERPTSVTAKYTTTPSYKPSSSIPVLSNEKNEKEKESPITAIANKYANYNKNEKLSSKYEKKDYSKLSVPSIAANKSRDPSPASASKYNLPRPSRHLSPERRTAKGYKDSRDTSPTDRDKDIPSKTDKSTSYNSLSSLKLYPRSSSYTRPSSRADPKPDVSLANYRPSRADPKPDISVSNYSRPYSRADSKSESTLSNYSRPPSRSDPKSDISSNYSRPSSRAETKPEITVNRYAIANRLSSNYLRSPPTVKRTSVSPVNHIEIPKKETEKSVSPVAIIEEVPPPPETSNESVTLECVAQIKNDNNETETVTIVTRHTSPTPPGSSSYVRSRRADMAKTIEKTITRLKRKPDTADKEIQSDRLDDPTRNSRFGSTARTSMSNWSYYTPNTNYTGYAGRYSTQYSSLSPPTTSYDRSSRSRSREPPSKDSSNTCTYSNNTREKTPSESNNPEIVTSVYEQNKGDDTSEIIINVNLKLKRAKSPSATELVSPEITITNSQLPPQAPKVESTTKTKKLKVRKSSTDSSSDSSAKKKVVKKRSKSVSSTDSDQGSEVIDKTSPPKSIPRNASSSNLVNGDSKLNHSKSRDSNSPESSITLSTQSSISEDETVSKSKTNDLSRTSADEKSLSMDRSGRQPSPQSQKENGTEEAKSFLIRALAPVTNLFKMRQPDSSENSRWLETSTSESTSKDVSNLITESEKSGISKSNNTSNIIATNDDNMVQFKSIRPLESGEKAWWLESDSSNTKGTPPVGDSLKTSSEKNIPRKIRHIESGERAWWLETNSESKSSNHIQPISAESSDMNRPGKKCKFADEEKPWWLDSCANIPEGIERLTPPRKSSSDSEKSEKFNFFKVRHNESGDQKDWWLTSNENSTNSNQQESQSLSKSGSKGSFPLRRIRHVESGERPWWLCSDKNIPEGIEKLPPPPQEESESSDSEEVQVYTIPSHVPPFPLHLPDDEPLGDRRSPEGLETPNNGEDYRGRTSPYENSRQFRRRSSANSYQKGAERYISRYTDIDDILGTSGQIYSPFMDSILARRTGQMVFDDDECEEIDPTQVRIHDSTPQRPVIQKVRSRSDIIDCRDEDQLDDATLQVFKDGDYGPYLDLDSTLGEQDEELEGLQDSRKNSLVLRTQLSVRVHTIIERLLHSQGRELRRALFSLKQILQSDKDLVHEFIANKGLDCLMQVGNMADHNYLDYILRALGQILLYVDGMHGVMSNKRCIQWLYSLICSRFRHVVKTALKLLVVFVEYTEQNSLLLIDAIVAVDVQNGRQPWYNIMKILQDVDASDTELLIYATTLINRCLNNVPNTDTYYDQVDSLQEQGMDDIIQLYMSKQGTDLDLLRQLQIFEAVLLFEDGDESGTALKQLDESVIKAIRRRSLNLNSTERRKSKKQLMKEKAKQNTPEPEPKPSPRPSLLPSILENKENKELSTALRRRRDRFARQQEMLKNSNGSVYNSVFNGHGNTNGLTNGSTYNKTYTNGTSYTSSISSLGSTNGSVNGANYTNGSVNGASYTNGNINGTSFNIGSPNGTSYTQSTRLTNGISNSTNFASCTTKSSNHTNGVTNGTNGNEENENTDSYVIKSPKNFNINDILRKSLNNGSIQEEDEKESNTNRSPKFSVNDVIKNGNQRYTSGLKQRIQNGTLGHSVTAVDALTVIRQKQLDSPSETKDDRGIILNKEHSIKDLAQRLTSPVSPTTEEKHLRVSDMAGIVSKAKEELAKSQSKEVIKSPTVEKSPKVIDIKVSENDLHWEELRKGCLNREFHLCDLDFSDLRTDSDDDMLCPAVNASNGPPPPPPGLFPTSAPPPLPSCFPPFPPYPRAPVPIPPKHTTSKESSESTSSSIKKNKKTVKLFWKEIQENPAPLPMRPKVGGFIWDDLPDIKLDTKMLEHLFESRTNDLIIKKLMEPKRNLILDAKRSNAINIAMKKLPTPQTIKAAIMKMDATVVGREGIEKLLTMLPTEEEKVKIQEAQYANPDLPLGSAEQFLLTLASINELSSRLKLWVFKLDYDNLEKEVAEPLMDLKQGIELLKSNRTFKVILSTLRSVGSFLNGSQVKGFRLEYLSKVMEVKDTVHKHPLLYHICEMIIDKFPESTDFFSEVGPVIRASKVDFDNLNANLQKLESDCKASWDHMKRVAKHDSSQIFKTKINEFITDAAERIILLTVIKKRVMSRYSKFLLFLGVPPQDIAKTKPSEFLKVIAEFALEYRTTRERVLQQLEKRANHRERNKTRGKMIIDIGKYSTKNGDNTADSALKELLKTDPDTDSLTKGRRKFSKPTANRSISVNGDLSADEEIIESLVRSATTKPRLAPRERRKNRISDKKHWNRTLDGHQSWPGRESNPGSIAESQQR